MDFADKLKHLRGKHGLSQAALAKKIFVSRSAVPNGKTDSGSPTTATCRRFATISM